MNQPMQGFGGTPTQQKCAHCGEMYASNYVHTCDSPTMRMPYLRYTYFATDCGCVSGECRYTACPRRPLGRAP